MIGMRQSVYQQLRNIGFSINRLWSNMDVQDFEPAARKSIEAVRRCIQAAQSVAKDYEMTEAEEDTKAQLRLMPKLVKALDQLRASILKASEYDLIGVVDVAQLSAELDDLTERYRSA